MRWRLREAGWRPVRLCRDRGLRAGFRSQTVPARPLLLCKNRLKARSAMRTALAGRAEPWSRRFRIRRGFRPAVTGAVTHGSRP